MNSPRMRAINSHTERKQQYALLLKLSALCSLKTECTAYSI